MAGLQHTPAVGMTGLATNDHVELDFVTTELDSRDGFGQEVCNIVCSWHVDNVDLPGYFWQTPMRPCFVLVLF